MEKIIIGGGPMGLAAAYELAKTGEKPILFEADTRLGGMSASFNFSGLNIERFYHFHCTSDHDYFEILDELKILHLLTWKNTKMGFYWNGELYKWGDPISLLMLPNLSLISKLRYGFHAFVSSKRSSYSNLDKIDAISWLKRWVGDQAFEVLWLKLFRYKFFEYENNVSAAWIWSRIKRIGNSRQNIFKEKLGFIEGGSERFINSISGKILELGGEIHLDEKVEKILIDNNKVIGIKTNKRSINAGTIISTIPINFIPKIAPDLPETIKQKFTSLKNIAVVCVIVKLKKKLTENFWLNINDERMDIPGLVEYSNLNHLGGKNIIYVPFYMPQTNPHFKETDNFFIEKVKEYFLYINKNLNDNDFEDIHVSRYLYSQPICEKNFNKKLPNPKLPINGLFIADTSYYYPEDRGISESVKFGRGLAKMALMKDKI